MTVSEDKVRKYGYTEGWLSIFGNLILFALKLWVGLLTSSVAITADAWHSLSDSLTSLVVIIGTKASLMPADRDHPFGHGEPHHLQHGVRADRFGQADPTSTPRAPMVRASCRPGGRKQRSGAILSLRLSRGWLLSDSSWRGVC